MIGRGKSGIYSYLLLFILASIVTFVWFINEGEKGTHVIVPFSFLRDADSVYISRESASRESAKVTIISKNSPHWGGSDRFLEKQVEVSSDPSFNGVARTNDFIGSHDNIREPSKIDKLILLLSEKPFLRQVDKAQFSEGQQGIFCVQFFNSDRKLVEFIVGPLSFSGGEVYVQNIAAGSVYLLKREFYFLIKDLHDEV